MGEEAEEDNEVVEKEVVNGAEEKGVAVMAAVVAGEKQQLWYTVERNDRRQ
jgi:hypothetical protein